MGETTITTRYHCTPQYLYRGYVVGVARTAKFNRLWRKVLCTMRDLNVLTVTIFQYCNLCGVSDALNLKSAWVLLQEDIEGFIVLHSRVIQNGDICTASDTRKIFRKEINGSIQLSSIIQILWSVSIHMQIMYSYLDHNVNFSHSYLLIQELIYNKTPAGHYDGHHGKTVKRFSIQCCNIATS